MRGGLMETKKIRHNQFMEFFRLSLAVPLRYRKEARDPFALDALQGGAGYLFCFHLDPARTGLIDPNPEDYLGNPAASGVSLPGWAPQQKGETRREGDFLELPAGRYYVTQVRRLPRDPEELKGLAVELQKEGLWERLKLGNTLFLRFLYEDGAPVVQLWRPLEK
jgi:hypothetical protein